MSKALLIKDSNQKSEAEKPKLTVDYEPCDIAFLMQQWSYYSGGRYYDFTISQALKEAGYDVICYSNMIARNIQEDFPYYEQAPVKECDLERLDVPHCSTVFAANHSALTAIRICAKYKKNLVLVVYDPPEWIFNCQYLKERGYDYAEITQSYRIKMALEQSWNQIPDIKIICLTEQAVPAFKSWYDIPGASVSVIEPILNTKTIEFINSSIKKKENIVVCVSRNDGRKNFPDVVAAFRNLYKDHELHFITNSAEGIGEIADFYKVPRNRIIIHERIPDIAKFSLIRKAKALISASMFEGYGMWALEGLACGTPVVCYDLLSLQHLDGLHKCKDFDQLEDTLNFIVKSPPPFDTFDYQKHSIEVAGKKLSSILGSIPSDRLKLYNAQDKAPAGILTRDFKTEPFLFHFNSIYREDIYGGDHINKLSWSKVLAQLEVLRPVVCSGDIKVITYSNYKKPTILEVCCERLGIPLEVRGKDWSWDLGYQFFLDKMEECASIVNSGKFKYYLILDASDVVLLGSPDILLNYKNIESKVLFAAEESCHPESNDIEDRQRKRAPKDTPFKFLNAGVLFGKQENLLEMYKEAIAAKPYPSSNKKIPDCDQGRFNQVYLNTDLIELDHYCQYFYCNDPSTIAEARLRFEYD